MSRIPISLEQPDSSLWYVPRPAVHSADPTTRGPVGGLFRCHGLLRRCSRLFFQLKYRTSTFQKVQDIHVPGKSAIFAHDDITIRYFGVADHLVFGFEYRNGVRMALPEKALLDTLYFYQHGARFFFDVFSDVNIAMFDQSRLDRFLANYKNPRFKAFATGYLYGDP